MFKKAPSDMQFVKREEEVLAFWRESGIFQKSQALREDAPRFTFYDGPPTANGKPHIGHILTRAIKDIIPRYKTMKGFRVLRKAGWDTHGLPVELEVEKQLGINGKPEIESYGIAPFIQKCKESVWLYKGEWERMSERVAFWADMENPYVTYHNSYIESEWWSLKNLWERDLLYKGHKVVPYCPRCGTALSSHEVAQGYKDVEDNTIIVRFKLKDEDAHVLVWTTTPWTLPSNVALCVNANETYVRARDHGQTVILAEALVESVLCEHAEILSRCKGKDLVGLAYEPLFPYYSGDKKAFFIVADRYVTLSDGTGVVHIAPAFGEDDARVGRENDLPFVMMVNEQGRFIDEAVSFAGQFVKEADPHIIAQLDERGALFSSFSYTHSYPFCWRCDTPLLYYARASWFIRMTAVRDALLRNNRSVNWMPENIKEGRMGNFLENVIDWGLSRERYWGTPLPIWECACGHRECVGSIAELREKANAPVAEDIELHRPFIDEVHLSCPKCGGSMTRVSEVIDCWYDSGAMPFAQWHYPFENKALFDATFPADFISEAVDQTRGWFYTLLAISTLQFDKSPFENCIVLGHVNDKDGFKMSKHKGNVVDPWSILDVQGADAVRWYFYTGSMPWLPSRFSADLVSEAQRKFMGTLWNTYSFFTLYAVIDSFDPAAHPYTPGTLTMMDRWIILRLRRLVTFVDEGLAAYKITETARALADFVDELSNWYVRRGRERYWVGGMEDDKRCAYHTLYLVLSVLCRLSAPYVPFMAEAMYQNLVRPYGGAQSVHLSDFPTAESCVLPGMDGAEQQALREGEDDVLSHMDMVLRIVAAGRSARNAAVIKNRQPLPCLFVSGAALPDEFARLIADELNVKEVRFVSDTREFTTYELKPQMKTLGPRYGKLLGRIGAHLKEADGNAVMDVLEAGKAYEFTLEGTEVSLTRDDVLATMTHKEGFVAAEDRGVTAVLDTALTPALIDEGLLREVVSKVQNMRRDAGFDVTDHIRLSFSGNDALGALLKANEAFLCAEVLADALVEGKGGAFSKEWDINGQTLTLGVTKV